MRPTIPTPTPIPACAPVDKPLDSEEEVGVVVGLANVEDILLLDVARVVEVVDEVLLLVVAVIGPTVVCSTFNRQSVFWNPKFEGGHASGRTGLLVPDKQRRLPNSKHQSNNTNLDCLGPLRRGSYS